MYAQSKTNGKSNNVKFCGSNKTGQPESSKVSYASGKRYLV